MNRLLERQIKYSLGKNFDMTTLPEGVQKLLERVNNSYDDFSKEKALFENTLEVNTNEITQSNKIIHDKSLETSYILKQYKDTIDTNFIVSKTDLQGNITFINNIFSDISGYSKEELLGRTHSIIQHSDNGVDFFQEMWQTITTEKVWTKTFANRAKDGSTYYVRATIAPLMDLKGNIKEYISISQNITEQILLEQRTKHLLDRTKQIMNAQDSMIIVSDSISGVIEANQKFYTKIGFKDFEDFKKSYKCICELFIEKGDYLKTSSEEHYWAEPLLKEPHKIHKALLLDANEEETIFSVTAKEIQLDNMTYILSTFSDVTAVERLREEAEASQKAKSDFLANMSHEIRTPMNGISGFLQLLEKTTLTPKQAHYLDITQSSMKTLLQIVNDILDFSKIESGNMESEFTEINPFVELEKSFITFIPKAKEKNISLQISIDPSINEYILMDLLHLHQVMQNLINNAIKFTPQHGTIIASVEKLSEDTNFQYLRFSVKDSGIGIAKENQNKILQAFSQADNSTTRKFGGTGLGLSISKSLVTLMGGELLIESELDKGSEFYFDLKLKKSLNKHRYLSDQLDTVKISILESHTLQSKKIRHQLECFKLHFTLFKEENVEKFLKENECNLYILDSKEVATQILNSQYFIDAQIILINEEAQDFQEIPNLTLLDSYDECPSQLYNILSSKKLFDDYFQVENTTQIFKLKILIAEDYEVNRILIEELLSVYQEIEFDFALNGQEAIEAIKKDSSYDLIFMDINMPVLDGMEATKILKEMKISQPIIALTANALKGDKEKFLKAGMSDYISKPIEISELERVLLKYSTLNSITSKCKEKVEEQELACENILEKHIVQTMKNTKFPRAIVLKLLKSYVNSSDKLLSTFLEGLTTHNHDIIMCAAHDLKSSSLTFYFESIGELMRKAESSASNGQDFAYQEAYERVYKHFTTLKSCLEEL